MARRAILILTLAACYVPTDPHAGMVHASIAFVVRTAGPDTLHAWRWGTLDTVHVASGDSVCIRFDGPTNRQVVWSYSTSYIVHRDVVWRTPLRQWPHLTVSVAGASNLYESNDVGCP